MSPVALTQQGAYPLLGVGALPNVDVAFPGEVWSNKRANGVIVPGAPVIPVMVSGVECVRPITGSSGHSIWRIVVNASSSFSIAETPSSGKLECAARPVAMSFTR